MFQCIFQLGQFTTDDIITIICIRIIYINVHTHIGILISGFNFRASASASALIGKDRTFGDGIHHLQQTPSLTPTIAQQLQFQIITKSAPSQG